MRSAAFGWLKVVGLTASLTTFTISIAMAASGSFSCAGFVEMSCGTGFNCVLSGNNHGLSLDFSRNRASFCYAVFCTAEAPLRVSNRQSVDGQPYTAFQFRTTRNQDGNRVTNRFFGVFDPAKKVFFLDWQGRRLVGTCT